MTTAQLTTLLRIQQDERDLEGLDEGEQQDALDPETTGILEEQIADRCIEELEFREKAYGEAYPFRLDADRIGRYLSLILRNDHLSPESGRLFYVFCLLDSVIREGLLRVDASVKRDIGTVFQIVACLATGGYVGGETVSFGFPRATGDAFHPALRDAWTRYGSYAVVKSSPFGFDASLKDGGIDIIAWRHFCDGYPATTLVFVQVASGLNWPSKDVAGDVGQVLNWIDSSPRPRHFLPAIAIPFTLWHDLNEPPMEGGRAIQFLGARKNRYGYKEGKFGIIFDRGRIATMATNGLQLAESGVHIDGYEQIDAVTAWVRQVLEIVEAEG